MSDDQRCARCGEHTHAGAAFCATCGARLAGADGSAPDRTPTSSEQVNAPAFGETGQPAVTPEVEPSSVERRAERSSVAPPTAAPPPADPTGTPADPSDRTTKPVTTWSHPTGPTPSPRAQSRSTSVMIAALAVAIVVIVGGIFILLASNRSGDDLGETGDSLGETPPSQVVTQLPAVDTASPETATSPPTTIVDTTIATTVPPATSTLPPTPTTVAPAPLPTVAPGPAPTLAPAPLPTAAPAPPGEVRGPGDLGLAQPILNEPCDGRYITFVGSAVGDRPYVDVVSELLATYPGTNYIWTKSCPSLRQVFRDGSDIYGVVFGPYATQLEACTARAAGPADAYVRRISTTDPEDHTIEC